MRIALVLHDYDPGFGQGRYAIELARYLAVTHQVYVLANSFASPPAPGIRFIRIPAHRFSALTTILSFIGPAERMLRRRPNPFDIIHAQGLSCWHADIVTAHICNAARSKSDPPKTSRQRLFSRIIDPIERQFYRKSGARHLIAVSKRVAEDVKRSYHWTRPSTVIYHGLCRSQILRPPTPSEKRAAKERFHLNPERRTWLFAGEARKGLETVIPQLARHPGVQLLCVSRSSTLKARSLADRLGVGERVFLHGPLSDLTAAYVAADVFVYPSAYDAFGMVAAEAMGAGLPVVIGVNTGAADWIQPGINGMICDPNHPRSLDEALDRIESDHRYARKLGDRARDTAATRTWDRCAAETEMIYETVLTRRGRE